jgi:hypothetical protein
LIDKEVEAGWVEIFPGTLEEAQQFFQHGLAVGRLGLGLSDSRPPRLVLDSTVCGVNPQCQIPEKSTLPTAYSSRCFAVVSAERLTEGHFRGVIPCQECPETSCSSP